MNTALNSYKVTPMEYLEYTKEILNKLNTDVELTETVEYILRDLDISDGFFQALIDYDGE